MFQKKLIPIFFIVCVDVLALTIVLPLLPFYAEKYGASPIVVSLIVTSFAICQLFSSPLLGRLSDQYGRKRLLVISQIGTFIGFLVLGFAQSLWMIFLGRIIDGITSGNLSIAHALISDLTEPHERAKSFALIGIAFGLGFLVGPAITGLLTGWGYHYPILAAAGLSFISIFMTVFMLPKDGSTRHQSERLSPKLALAYFSKKPVNSLLIEFLIFAFAFSIFLSGFALFAERRFGFGAREVAYVFAYTGLLGIIFQGGMVGRLVDKFGEKRLIIAGFLISGSGYLMLGASHRLSFLAVGLTFFTLGHSIIRPSVTSLISRQSGKDEQGIVLGLTQSLNSLSAIIAPMIGGVMIEYGFLTVWAMSSGFIMILGGLLATLWNRNITLAQPSPVG